MCFGVIYVWSFPDAVVLEEGVGLRTLKSLMYKGGHACKSGSSKLGDLQIHVIGPLLVCAPSKST